MTALDTVKGQVFVLAWVTEPGCKWQPGSAQASLKLARHCDWQTQPGSARAAGGPPACGRVEARHWLTHTQLQVEAMDSDMKRQLELASWLGWARMQLSLSVYDTDHSWSSAGHNLPLSDVLQLIASGIGKLEISSSFTCPTWIYFSLQIFKRIELWGVIFMVSNSDSKPPQTSKRYFYQFQLIFSFLNSDLCQLCRTVTAIN